MASPLTSLSSRCFNYPTLSELTNTRAYDGLGILPATSFAKVKHEIPFFSSLFLLCALCVFALTFSPVFSVSPLTAHDTSEHSRSYLGFDRNMYPGDSSLPILRKSFAFISYWLSPPARRKAQHLEGKARTSSLTWFGFLVLYRGPDSGELKSETDARVERE